MKEITKTIQIYTPDEKIPASGSNFIAITKPYNFEEDGENYIFPSTLHLGFYSGNKIQLVAETGSIFCTEEKFKAYVKEWYFIE